MLKTLLSSVGLLLASCVDRSHLHNALFFPVQAYDEHHGDQVITKLGW